MSASEHQAQEREQSTIVQTFGCRLNEYESQLMRQHADAAGLENTIILNSCAVTAEAERQLRQSIRKTRRENPEAKIVVTGCAAQVHAEDYAAMEEVDLVVGNEEKLKEESWQGIANREVSQARSVDRASHEQRQRVSLRGQEAEQETKEKNPFITPHEKILVNDIMSVKETAGQLLTHFEGRARAFVQVQNGCNHRCTFCIIPFGRGNSRSVPMGEVVNQIRKLVNEQGFKEVVLTGVDISDYGDDLPAKPTLGELCQRILSNVPELPRLRLSSIDAVEVDDTLYRLIADEPRLMPHLHISLQAADDMVLKRMKRRHLRGDIVEFCQKVIALRPDMVFGADIIAGFPTETDAMFENTLRLLNEIPQLMHMHIFPYSERDGTPAAKMPQVRGDVRKARAAKLRVAGERNLEQYLLDYVGLECEVLIEKNGRGHSEHFAPVKIDGAEDATLVKARITGYEDGVLIGEAV